LPLKQIDDLQSSATNDVPGRPDEGVIGTSALRN
jgi:hypothetical protein